MNTHLRAAVITRARGRCEAPTQDGGRCRGRAGEVHHRLTKARGGRLLDAWAADRMAEGHHVDPCWLVALCVVCHRRAHDSPWGVHTGLVARGTVATDPSGTPRYRGTDVELTRAFG